MFIFLCGTCKLVIHKYTFLYCNPIRHMRKSWNLWQDKASLNFSFLLSTLCPVKFQDFASPVGCLLYPAHHWLTPFPFLLHISFLKMDGHFIRKQACLVFLFCFGLAFWTISSYFFLTTRKKGQYTFFHLLMLAHKYCTLTFGLYIFIKFIFEKKSLFFLFIFLS